MKEVKNGRSNQYGVEFTPYTPAFEAKHKKYTGEIMNEIERKVESNTSQTVGEVLDKLDEDKTRMKIKIQVEKEVTIYVESFADVLEIVDKMHISISPAVLFMDEETFFKEGKCHVIIGNTMFIFLPVQQLFRAVLKERDMTAIDEFRAFGMKEKEKRRKVNNGIL